MYPTVSNLNADTASNTSADHRAVLTQWQVCHLVDLRACVLTVPVRLADGYLVLRADDLARSDADWCTQWRTVGVAMPQARQI